MNQSNSFRMLVKSRLSYLIAFALLFISVSIQAQNINISGKVIFKGDGAELPGVTVMVLGTQKGATTNLDGIYTLNDIPQDAVLVFSFIGMQSQQVNVNNRTVIDVVLEEEAKLLTEIVVTALAIEKSKTSLGYSVSQVGADEVSQAKENNVMNSLAGKVAGLRISKTASGLDGSTRVVLRGAASLKGNNRPLVVVDGVPMGGGSFGTNDPSDNYGADMGDALSDINPEDVESISVLKGAGASAAYGSRGGNGVILITTKKGKARDGLGIEYASNYVVEQPYLFNELQNEYGQGAFGTYPTNILASKAAVPFSWSYGPPMDGRMVTNAIGEQESFVPADNPFKSYYKNGSSFVNTIALKGGNNDSNFRVSLTNQNSTGTTPNSKLAKQTFNARGFTHLGNFIEMDSKVTYVHHQAYDRPYIGEDISNAAFAFNNMPRNISTQFLRDNIYDDEGNQFWWWDGTSGNPYWSIENKRNWDERNRIQTLMSLKVEFTENLTLLARSGFDLMNRIETNYGARGNVNIGNYTGSYKNVWSNVLEWNTDYLLTYKKIFSDDLIMDFNIGNSHRYNQFKEIGQSGNGWKLDNFYKVQNLERYYTNEYFSEREVWSTYFLSNVSWKDYLFFDFTIRNDVSSTIPVDGRANSYMYHSENASLVFTDLFDIRSSFLTSGKLRGSYALVGNDTGPYQTNNYYSIPANALPYKQAYMESQLAFNDLLPEMTHSWEVGTNLSLFDARMEFDFTYYTATTENQLMPVIVAPSTGFGTRKFNAGAVNNRGFEMQLSGTPLQNTGDLRWNTILNVSKNQSEVVSLYQDEERLVLGGVPFFEVTVEARPGDAYGQLYSRDYQRNENGDILVDNNGYPIATTELLPVGDMNPDLMLGWSNSLTYKALSLSFLIDAQIGGDYYSQTAAYGNLFGTGMESLEGRDEWYATHQGVNYSETIPGVFPDGFIQEGVVNTAAEGETPVYVTNTKPVDPLFYHIEVLAFRQIMSGYIKDATNVRLREVVLSYNFPPSVLSKTFINAANISFVGRNLFFLYNANKMLDPESGGANQNIGPSIELNAMPGTRTMGVNLKISF